MSEDEINRAIAEHLGWMRHPTCKKVWRTPEQCERNRKLIGTVSGPWSTESSGPPNFCGDLNAMHEAEKTAFDGNEGLWAKYLDVELPKLAGERPIECSGARQRAEAFLRTVGKWKENE
jgi:hypothetical protein